MLRLYSYSLFAQQSTKLLIIARGPSGSGKSLMAKQLASKYDAPVFSTDDFFTKEGKYVFDANNLPAAHEWNKKRVEKAMQEGLPAIIVDNTNSQFWEMRPYVQLAQEHGYEVEFKEPDWNKELKTPEGKWNPDFLTRMQQSKERLDANKTLPPEVVQRMVNRYQYNPTVESVLQGESL